MTDPVMDNYTFFQVLVLLTLLPFAAFCRKRLFRYMRYFQQEEYDGKRFTVWLWENKAFDKYGSVAVLVSLAAGRFAGVITGLIIQIAALTALSYFENDPRKSGKIKLNMTARAARIYNIALALLLAGAFGLVVLVYYGYPAALLMAGSIVLFHLTPFALILANAFLSPVEKRIKEGFKNEAKEILKRINPYVIGITGSYGKTSTKSALGEILNTALAPAFCPPKSINTEMGITREIRENMKPGQKYAVIEMGAYNVGSIKRLCALTPPHAAIVTVVGMAHLERYGSLERVYQAKSELPQALPPDGILVCNGDDPGARKMAAEYPRGRTFLYGFNNEKGDLNCFAHGISFSREGTSFTLNWESRDYPGFTRLLGLPALSNLLGAFTMACALGADPEFVLATIRNIQPVDNRLSLSREGEVTFLRDAYNSNPPGFEAALNVLSGIAARRKILMTPGMVELGPLQHGENKKAAKKAAGICDRIIIVGLTNREALKAGLEEGGFNMEHVIFSDTRNEAFLKLNELIQPDDLILIENDLPDLYETKEWF